jgi:thiamine-monophosphate kinase
VLVRYKLIALINISFPNSYTKNNLAKLLRGKTISSKSRFINPELRGGFLYQASKYINSAIDISDGLNRELSRLSDINRVGFRFLHTKTKQELYSGEEYELLFSFSKNRVDIIKSIAKKHRVKIDIFAVAKRGRYICHGGDNHFG